MISQKNRKILNILRENCKIPTKEIGKRLNMPITTVHNHIKKMEREGVIKGYTAIVDYKKLGKNIQAFIHISTFSGGKNISQEEIANQLYNMPEVVQCFTTTGKNDIIIYVTAQNIEELNNFVNTKIKKLDGIDTTDVSIIMSDTAEKFRDML